MVKQGEDSAQYIKMTTMPVGKLVARLAVPTITSMLVTNIYNLVDTMFVGMINTEASGAVSVVFGFMAIIQAIGFMFGHGAGSILSRKLGEKDREGASRIASTAFLSVLIIGTILAIASMAGSKDLVYLLGSTDEIAPYAQKYLFCILIATPFTMASFVMNNALRYEGRAVLGMIGILAGAVLNIAGDPILMFGCGLGIVGAGMATAIGQIAGFVILFIIYSRGKTAVILDIHKITKDIREMGDILGTGFPSLVRQGLTSIATIILNNAAEPYGKEAIAAMGIVGKVGFFVFAIALGVGQGFQPVSAMNYGAGKFKRVRDAYKFTNLMAEALMFLAAVPVFIFAGPIIRRMRDDEEVIRIGIRALRIYLAALFTLPPCMVTEMLYQSTGHKLGASILSSLRSGLFFIPLIIILSRLRGLSGIQEAQPLAFILAVVPSLFMAVVFFRKLPKEDINKSKKA